MSLDPPYIPEFAQAGFLAPVPEDVAAAGHRGRRPERASSGSTWNDELVAIPFWANTQLLWYRKSVAEAAGLDMTQPVTWDQLVEAAQDQDKTRQRPGHRPESLTVWVNALIESAGGHIIEENADRPRGRSSSASTLRGGDARPPRSCATWPTSGPSAPAFSTAERGLQRHPVRERGRRLHGQLAVRLAPGPHRGRGGHAGAVGARRLRLGALPAGRRGRRQRAAVRRDQPRRSAPSASNVDFAFEAAECITSEENQAYYFDDQRQPRVDGRGLRRPRRRWRTSRRRR